MINTTGGLNKSVISAVSFEGLTITTSSGRPAVIDESGKVIEAGNDVAAALGITHQLRRTPLAAFRLDRRYSPQLRQHR